MLEKFVCIISLLNVFTVNIFIECAALYPNVNITSSKSKNIMGSTFQLKCTANIPFHECTVEILVNGTTFDDIIYTGGKCYHSTGICSHICTCSSDCKEFTLYINFNFHLSNAIFSCFSRMKIDNVFYAVNSSAGLRKNRLIPLEKKVTKITNPKGSSEEIPTFTSQKDTTEKPASGPDIHFQGVKLITSKGTVYQFTCSTMFVFLRCTVEFLVNGISNGYIWYADSKCYHNADLCHPDKFSGDCKSFTWNHTTEADLTNHTFECAAAFTDNKQIYEADILLKLKGDKFVVYKKMVQLHGDTFYHSSHYTPDIQAKNNDNFKREAEDLGRSKGFYITTLMLQVNFGIMIVILFYSLYKIKKKIGSSYRPDGSQSLTERLSNVPDSPDFNDGSKKFVYTPNVQRTTYKRITDTQIKVCDNSSVATQINYR